MDFYVDLPKAGSGFDFEVFKAPAVLSSELKTLL